MKPLLVMLLIAASVHAQSLADIARKERERRAALPPTRVITSIESKKAEEPKPAAGGAEAAKTGDAKSTDAKPADGKPADGKAATTEPPKEPPKPQGAPAVDPVQAWNTQLDQLRVKIRGLQDQETALMLQLNQANNQVYAPVTDPATQQRALQAVGAIQLQLANARRDLDDARKTLDAMQLQGPPKK